MKKKSQTIDSKGFTLAELLIVVAIVGILVAISIPIFRQQLHKARVAADWANLRSYFSEIQADYISTGKQNPAVKTDWWDNPAYDWTSITFLDGKKVKMKAGKCGIDFNTGPNGGYSITYNCNKSHPGCELDLAVKQH